MRRFAAFLSWVSLVAAVGAALAIYKGALPFAAPGRPGGSGQSVAGNAGGGPAAVASAPFAGFPLDEARTIDFDLDELTMNQFNAREKVDQKRDWLLLTVVSNSGASADAINRSLYDLAPVRHGYMHQVARFEYGQTRYCYLDAGSGGPGGSGSGGVVVALIPRPASDGARLDDLGHVFDEVRKNLGAAPARLEVFEYTLEGSAQATVTRRASVAGDDFLKPASGYHEATVASAEQLGAFLGSVDDLVFAHLGTDGALRLGGRKLAKAAYQNIALTDVAAIWQAEQQIRQRLDEQKAIWDRKFDEFNARWRLVSATATNQQLHDSEAEQIQSDYREETERLHLVSGSGFSLDPAYDYTGLADALSGKDFFGAIKAVRDAEESAIPADGSVKNRDLGKARGAGKGKDKDKKSEPDAISLATLLEEVGIAPGTLDTVVKALRAGAAPLPAVPASSAPGADSLTRLFGPGSGPGFKADASPAPAFEDDFPTPASTPAVAGAAGSSPEADSLKDLLARLRARNPYQPGNPLARTGRSAAAHRSPAAKPDVGPFLQLLGQVRQKAEAGDDFKTLALSLMLQRLDLKYRYQAARYDGPLNGTEAGMTLFYTDLLAKLWFADYEHSTPSGEIPDFTPDTRLILPTVYRAELEKIGYTRLWFGPEDNGYQIVDRGTLHFARNATRIFAASRGDSETAKEVAPNAFSEAFLGWWNNHYEEVAQYEPQYQRLNEIMKWSLLIGWLNNAGAGQRLGALADIHVDHSAWFPDWARQAAGLRFHDWAKVKFYPRDQFGAKTETMPLLVSYSYVSFPDEDVKDPPWHLEGGVSLASRDIFETRAALTAELPAAMRRSGLDYSRVSGSATDELVNFRGTRYHFGAAEKPLAGGGGAIGALGRESAILDVTAKDGLKFRARYGELSQGRFSRQVTREAGAVQVEARAGASEIGRFEAAPSKNGFRVGWRARDVEDGYALGRRLSSEKDFGAALQAEKSVEYAVADAKTGEYYVKTYGSENKRWIKFAPEGKPTPDVAGGWDGRVADLTPTAQPVNVAWVDESQLPREVVESGRWVRGPPPPHAAAPAKLPATLDEKVARIAGDPVAYKAQLDAEFKTRLQDIDHLLASGQPRRALPLIEDGIGQFGSHEQLQLRQAIVEASDARPAAAADVLNGIKTDSAQGGHNMGALFDEINARLKAGNSAPGLPRMAESLDWRTSPLKPAGDAVRLEADGAGGLQHELRMAEPPPPGAKPVAAADVPADALIYHQDHPGLNNFDWNVSVKSSLDQVAARKVGVVVELPRADIAHFNPAHIETPTAKFSRAQTASASVRTPAVSPAGAGYKIWAGPRATATTAMTMTMTTRTPTAARGIGAHGACTS